MKKEYPELEIEVVKIDDVICTSDSCNDPDELVEISG